MSFRLAQAELKRERRASLAEPDLPHAPPELVGLMDALRRLSPNQRAAIVMRYEAPTVTVDQDLRLTSHQGVAAFIPAPA